MASSSRSPWELLEQPPDIVLLLNYWSVLLEADAEQSPRFAEAAVSAESCQGGMGAEWAGRRPGHLSPAPRGAQECGLELRVCSA